MPVIMLKLCGKCYRKKKPSDYVIATGKQYTVKQFVNLVLNELDIKFKWKGKGLKEKCYDKNGNCIVACSKEYFRPLEVDTLLGNARKAKKETLKRPMPKHPTVTHFRPGMSWLVGSRRGVKELHFHPRYLRGNNSKISTKMHR